MYKHFRSGGLHDSSHYRGSNYYNNEWPCQTNTSVCPFCSLQLATWQSAVHFLRPWGGRSLMPSCFICPPRFLESWGFAFVAARFCAGTLNHCHRISDLSQFTNVCDTLLKLTVIETKLEDTEQCFWKILGISDQAEIMHLCVVIVFLLHPHFLFISPLS